MGDYKCVSKTFRRADQPIQNRRAVIAMRIGRHGVLDFWLDCDIFSSITTNSLGERWSEY